MNKIKSMLAVRPQNAATEALKVAASGALAYGITYLGVGALVFGATHLVDLYLARKK